LTDAHQRREQLAAQFPSLKIDALLVTSASNIRYLTGYTGSNGLLLLAPARAWFFTDPRYTIQAAHEVDCPTTTVKKGPLLDAALPLIKKHGYKRIGFEQQHLSYKAFTKLKGDLPLGVGPKGIDGAIEKIRMVKSPAEIDLIRASVLTNSKAYELAMRRVKPSMTESDLAAEIEYRMRRLGAEKPAFDTISVSGERTALPHARPGHHKFGNNQLLLIDMGATRDGYTSDMTRMAHIGKPSTRTRDLFNAVLESQLAAIDTVRPGRAAADVDKAARRVLKKHKLDKMFVHSTGHGLGLDIHEAPRLGKADNTRLEPGMVITIEPGAYIEGFGGVRIEDTVLVTESGCEILTPTPKELLVL
jgi:Xaa-Pro aminopeptidase